MENGKKAILFLSALMLLLIGFSTQAVIASPDGISGQLVAYSADEEDFVIVDGVLQTYTGAGGVVVIPDGVTEIGDNVFANNQSVTGLVLNEGLVKIGNEAFHSCRNIKGALELPSTVKSIGERAFMYCSGFTGLSLNTELESIGRAAFFMCSGFRGDLIIPDMVTRVDVDTFNHCSGFNGRLKLSKSISSVDLSAFEDCPNIKGELVIPDSVTFINAYAFNGMQKITSISFGEGLQWINDTSVFGNCVGVTKISFASKYVLSNAPAILRDFSNLKTIYVPDESLAAYVAALEGYISEGAEILPLSLRDDEVVDEDEEDVNEEDFFIVDGVLQSYMGEGGVVVLPKRVREIGGYAFAYNSSVTGIVFNDGLEKIGDWAFAVSGLIGTLELPDSLESIGDYAFYYDIGLTSLKLGSGVKNIGEGAFYYDIGLTSLKFGSGVESIGGHAFYGCNNLSGVLELPLTTVSIGQYAFADCSGFSGLALNTGLETIGNNAFSWCQGFRGDLIIPDTVTNVGESAFYFCYFDGVLKLSKSMTVVSEYTFAYNYNLIGELLIPDSITDIGYAAFHNMSRLTSISFGKGLQFIDSNAFSYCDSVTELSFASELVPENSASILVGFSNLKMIYVPDESFAAYVEAMSGSLPSGAEILTANYDDEVSSFLIVDGVLQAYLGDGGRVKIPEGVTEIGDSAFANNRTVTKVVFNEGLKKIGDSAFMNAALIGAIEFPESLESIGAYAFSGTTGLAGVLQIPDKVVSIGNAAFYNNRDFTSLKLGSSVVTIGDEAFQGCTRIMGVLKLPSTTVSIGQRAFMQCLSFTELSLNMGLKTIGDMAFWNCPSISGDLIIPDTVTSVGSDAFGACYALNGRLQLSESMTAVNSGTFSDNNNITGELVIPDSVLKIDAYAFRGLSKLRTIRFGKGLERINNYVFGNCTGVTKILFAGAAVPDNAALALADLSNLERIYVPKESLAAYVEALSAYLPERIEILAVDDEAADGFIIVDGVLERYVGDGGIVTIPEGVREIETAAFIYNKAVTGIVFNEGLKKIGAAAFMNTGLTGVLEFPDSLESIGAAAFQGLDGLTGIKLNLGLAVIGDDAFNGCTGLAGALEIPDTVVSIGEAAFREDRGFTSLKLGSGIISIGNYAFYNCYALGGVFELPTEIESIGNYAFYNCYSLEGVLELPLGVERIGNYTFYNCSRLSGVLELPSTVVSIGDYAFYNCYNLSGLRLNTGLETIGNGAFYYCSGFRGELLIPDTVISVGSYAFYNCGFDGEIHLSESMTVVNNSAFYYCHNITGELVIPDAVTNIYAYAFYNMPNLTSIRFGRGLKAIDNNYNYTFDNCAGVTEISFASVDVPAGAASILASFSNLETIYVPQDSFAAYVAALSGSISEGTQILPDGGETSDFVIVDGVLQAYLGDGGVVEIPEGVVEIAASVFAYNTSVTEVIFNDELVKIGDSAFNSADIRGSLEFPDSLESIGEAAFRRTMITSISLNSGLKTIEDDAFVECVGLTGALEIPDTVVSIGAWAFAGDGLLTSLKLGSSVVTIGEHAFYGCRDLRGDLILPSSMVSIGDYAFVFAYSTMPTLSRTVSALEAPLAGTEDSTFNAYSESSTLTLNVGLETIGTGAFEGCSELRGDLIIPDTVTSVGAYAFAYCGFDGRLQLSESMTVVNNGTFDHCRKITGELVIPDSVTNIYGIHTFAYMEKLTSIRFGEGLQAIDNSYYNDIFDYCSGVTELSFASAGVPEGAASILAGFSSLKTIYVPWESFDAYVTALSDSLAEGVEIVADTIGMALEDFRAEKVYSNTAVLSWTKHVNDAVTEYVIVRDGEEIARTSGTEYTDRSLKPGTHYNYSIYGVTESGRQTGRTSADVTTAAPSILDISTDAEQNRIAESNNAIHISVLNTKNLLPLGEERTSGVLYYYTNDENGDRTRYLIGEAVLGADTLTETYAIYTARWDVTDIAEGEYEVEFVLTDVDGVEGVKKSVVTVDHNIPETIVGVQAIGDVDGITLTWSISAEVSTSIYRIYKRSQDEESFKVVVISGRNILTFRDTEVNPDSLYYYYVTGVNSFGLESMPSDIAIGQKGTDTEPPVITRLTPATSSYINGNTSLAVTAQDNVAVTKVELYYSLDGETWELYRAISREPFQIALDTTAFPDGTIRIRAAAYDARGNAASPLTN
ncbi:MAG: leucine-rich repeat protein, partial [Clostridiales Family XIII bacterium]|nr:leucine-rich repeat protein [Clostridiales Family XIII bacterium]